MSEEPSDRVRAEWLRRIEAEYRSAAITQHLGLWLIQIGAPPELVQAALVIVSDEMTHAELCHATFVAAGGTDTPNLARETLELSRSRAPLEHDVTRHGVAVFCLGETVAVRLFQRLRRGCTVPIARRSLDRVLRDEVRHCDFGWTLLEWMLSTQNGPELRALVTAELPAMLRRLRQSYASGRLERPSASSSTIPDFSAADRAWGLMPASEYADAVDETWRRDYTPRFGSLGIVVPG